MYPDKIMCTCFWMYL